MVNELDMKNETTAPSKSFRIKNDMLININNIESSNITIATHTLIPFIKVIFLAKLM